MTIEEFDLILRILNRQRPFREYVLEFISGVTQVIRHPEAISRRGAIYHFTGPTGENCLFGASSVCRLIRS